MTAPLKQDFISPIDSRDPLRLWLSLITLTKGIEKKIRRNFETEFGTTLPRFDVLATLDHEGKKMTMGDLTEKLLVSKGNVTGVVASLVDQGLIKRKQDEADRRTHYLSLTPKGKAAFAEMAQAHKRWVDEVFSGLEAHQIRAMLDHLGSLKMSLGEKS